MDLSIVIIIFLILILIYLVYSTQNKNKYSDSSEIQNQITQISNQIDQKLFETNKILFDQLNQSNSQLQNQGSSSNELLRKINENNNKILQEVTEKLIKVEDTNKQVVGFAEQLQNIQNIFKNPKQRGIIGEYFLEAILSNVLPETVFEIQYKYKNGEIVDAVIFVKDKIVPIDAKFSTDSYSRIYDSTDQISRSKYEKDFVNDVKKRIDETSKYVSDEENTIDIAFMFVPSDAIYNEIISSSNDKTIPFNLITYAYTKKVVIVSPTSFFAYLQTVLLALNTIKIEGRVDEIIQYLNESTKYLKDFEESVNKLGKNIGTVVNAFNKTASTSSKLSKRLSKATNNKNNILNIEKVKELDDEEESLEISE